MDESLLPIIFDIHPTASLVLLGDGRIESCNRAARELFDMPHEAGLRFADFAETTGESFDEALPRLASSSGWQPAAVTLTRGEQAGLRVRLSGRGLGPGRDRIPRILVALREPDARRFEEHRKLIRALNGELAEQRSLREALDRQLENERHLRRELIHRVKNNLSLLAVIVRTKWRAAALAEVREVLGNIEQRIRSVALVHELLDRKQEIDIVDADALIEELCSTIGHTIAPPNVTIEPRLVPVQLHVSEATPLSLLVNELVTNALKHAFPGGRAGRVEVTLARVADGALMIRVADNGSGLDPDQTRTGTGSQIVEALAQQMEGELSCETCGGTAWTLVFSPRTADSARTAA